MDKQYKDLLKLLVWCIKDDNTNGIRIVSSKLEQVYQIKSEGSEIC